MCSNLHRENSACSTNQTHYYDVPYIQTPSRDFWWKELDSVNLAVLGIVAWEILLMSPKSYTRWGGGEAVFWFIATQKCVLNLSAALIRRTLYLNPWRDFRLFEWRRMTSKRCRLTSMWLSNHLKDASATKESDGARNRGQYFGQVCVRFYTTLQAFSNIYVFYEYNILLFDAV